MPRVNLYLNDDDYKLHQKLQNKSEIYAELLRRLWDKQGPVTIDLPPELDKSVLSA